MVRIPTLQQTNLKSCKH